MAKYKDHNQDKYIIAGVAAVLIIIGLIAVWVSTVNSQPQTATSTDQTLASSTIPIATSTSPGPVPIPGDLKTVTLAKCLAQKKITMYGAAWCTHCQDQKKAFGGAWQYVPYVECPDNVQLCISKQVKGYPTWMKSDGTQLEGFIELNKLANWAGCSF